jgi:hypothetical protein
VSEVAIFATTGPEPLHAEFETASGEFTFDPCNIATDAIIGLEQSIAVWMGNFVVSNLIVDSNDYYVSLGKL